MEKELELIASMKKKMFEAVEGIYSGDCKNLTVLRLEEAFDILKKIEEEVKSSGCRSLP